MIEEMRQSGYNPPNVLIPGKIIRFPGIGKSSKDDDAGWCYLFPGGDTGIYGDWSSGLKKRWQKDKNIKFNPQQLIDFQKIQKKIEEKQEKEYAKAALKAKKAISKMTDAGSNHPYLKKKGIKLCGDIKVDKEMNLIVPYFDKRGNLSTYQSISLKGQKLFFTGGRHKGSAFPIKGNKDVLYIVEGYATGASIFEATGNMVLVAGNSGNLPIVFNEMKKKDHQRIIIAADNDQAGIEAAKKCETTYIVPPETGMDWNDYYQREGLEKTKQIILELISSYKKITISDIKAESKTLLIPEELYSEGLITLGIQAAGELSGIAIPQYNIPTVLAHILSALAKIICCKGIYPSCFFIRIGSTQSGKTDTDKAFKRLFTPYFDVNIKNKEGEMEIFNTFYGPTNFASGPGLLNAVQQHPKCLIMIDEVAYLFSGDIHNPLVSGMRSSLLELTTAAGQRIQKCYANGTKDIVIDNSCINLTGNATPLIFNAFRLDDLQNGLIQRLDFFCYDGPMLERETDTNPESLSGKQFAEKLLSISQLEKPSGKYNVITNSSVDIGVTDEVKKLNKEYAHQLKEEYNVIEDEGIKGIISKKYNESFKFAMSRIVNRPIKDMFSPLEVADYIYGQKWAELLADWKINILTKNIHAGEFDSFIGMLVDGAKSAIKMGRRPTSKLIVHQRPKLRNLKAREFDEVVRICQARKLIQTREDRGRTLYEPILFKEEK